MKRIIGTVALWAALAGSASAQAIDGLLDPSIWRRPAAEVAAQYAAPIVVEGRAFQFSYEASDGGWLNRVLLTHDMSGAECRSFHARVVLLVGGLRDWFLSGNPGSNYEAVGGQNWRTVTTDDGVESGWANTGGHPIKVNVAYERRGAACRVSILHSATLNVVDGVLPRPSPEALAAATPIASPLYLRAPTPEDVGDSNSRRGREPYGRGRLSCLVQQDGRLACAVAADTGDVARMMLNATLLWRADPAQAGGRLTIGYRFE